MNQDVPDVVIFDCDGVLLETAELKTQAFADLFADHPNHVDAIVALHKKKGGLSRYVKFDMIHQDILELPLSNEHRAWLGQEYSRLVIDGVMGADVVVGTFDVLADLTGASVPAYVSSGSPHNELLAALDHHGIMPSLEAAWGHPTTKPEAIVDVLGRHGARPDRTVFVGDAWSDFEAAHGADLHFLGRVPEGHPNPFPDSIIVGNDLHDLRSLILEPTWDAS